MVTLRSQGSDPPRHPIVDKSRLDDLHRGAAAGERLELLKLRESEDPTARAIALLGSLLLRRLDGIDE